MAQWAPFVVSAALLTVVLLVLARRSQRVVKQAATGSDQSTPDASHRLSEPTPAHYTETGSERRRASKALREPTPVHPAATESQERDDPFSDIELSPRLMLVNVLFTQSLVAALVLAAVWYFAVPASALGITGNPANSGLPAVALGVAFGLALWVGNELAGALAAATGSSYDESVRQLLAPDAPGGWAVLFGIVLPVIAVAEELLFRAALVGVPTAVYDISPWLLVALSSVAFALGHGAQGRMGIAVTGALGLVLGAGYVLTGSLVVVVVAHYVVNAMEFYLHEYHGLPDLSTVSLDFPRWS